MTHDESDAPEHMPVAFEVLGIEPAAKGTLAAVAIVRLSIAGIEFTLQGVTVHRRPDGPLDVRAPTFRHPRTGALLPAVLLPDGLREALAAEIGEVFAACPAGFVAATAE